jgi:hypothetical protein
MIKERLGLHPNPTLSWFFFWFFFFQCNEFLSPVNRLELYNIQCTCLEAAVPSTRYPSRGWSKSRHTRYSRVSRVLVAFEQNHIAWISRFSKHSPTPMDVTLAITISYSETVFRASREMQMHVFKNGINVFVVTADSQCRQRFVMDTTSFN